MLGPAKSRRLDQLITVSVEELVPRDHIYRHLETKLDLSFVRDWTRELYAGRGRPGIDPVVFFKLQLVMVFEGCRSERHHREPAGAVRVRFGLFPSGSMVLLRYSHPHRRRKQPTSGSEALRSSHSPSTM
jgi:hypothetical protein